MIEYDEREREQERVGLREAMRKAGDVAYKCKKLLDLAGIPPGDLVERVRWITREYSMPGWHDMGEKTAKATEG